MRMSCLVWMSAAACCASLADEPSARAVLAGVRCTFALPHGTSRHRMELKVNVQPEVAGWRVCGAVSDGRRIRARDAAGNELLGEMGEWEPMPECEDACSVWLTFPLSGKTRWLDVDETLHVQLAEHSHTRTLGEVSLVAPAAYAVGGVEFVCVPEEGNDAADNRESDGSLRCARLTLIYPDHVNILRVGRVWPGGVDEETKTEWPPYAQDLDIKDTAAAEGLKRTVVELWHAEPAVLLEVTTCASRSMVDVPLRFRAMLGDPAPPAADAARGAEPATNDSP